MKHKFRFLSLLLAVVICSTAFFAVSCSGKAIIIETNTHKIYKEDGRYYMELSEPEGEGNTHVENRDVGFFRYGSMDELMKFLSAEFSDAYNKGFRAEFFDPEKDGVIELFNVENVQLPVFPEKFDSYEVRWYGGTYKFVAENDNEGITLKMHTAESFTKLVEKYRNARYSDDATDDLSIIDGIEATLHVFPDANYKTVYYEHEENGRRIYVQEQYTDINAEAPEFISMYVNDNGIYYRVLIAYPSESYTLEQLMAIKTTPYVPEDTATE